MEYECTNTDIAALTLEQQLAELRRQAKDFLAGAWAEPPLHDPKAAQARERVIAERYHDLFGRYIEDLQRQINARRRVITRESNGECIGPRILPNGTVDTSELDAQIRVQLEVEVAEGEHQ